MHVGKDRIDQYPTRKQEGVRMMPNATRPTALALTPEEFFKRWSYRTNLLSEDFEEDMDLAPPNVPAWDDMEGIGD